MQQFPYSIDSSCGGGARPGRHHPSGHTRGLCPFLRQLGASASAENGQSDTIPSLRTSRTHQPAADRVRRPTSKTDAVDRCCLQSLHRQPLLQETNKCHGVPWHQDMHSSTKLCIAGARFECVYSMAVKFSAVTAVIGATAARYNSCDQSFKVQSVQHPGESGREHRAGEEGMVECFAKYLWTLYSTTLPLSAQAFS